MEDGVHGVHTMDVARYVEEAPSTVEELAQIHPLITEDEIVRAHSQNHDLATLILVQVDLHN